MDAEINDSPGTLITNSAAICRFQFKTPTIWIWSQPLHIPSSASCPPPKKKNNTIVPIVETTSTFFFHSYLKPRSRAAKTNLIQNLI